VAAREFDAVLLLSFGGPEGPDDVKPFLRNVTRGRPVPPERLEEVAQHYMRFGGRSPINDQNRALLAALRAEMAAQGRIRPLYWGNRNWAPYLADTVAEMAEAGVRRAAVFVTSAYSSYSSCRQYLEDLEAARKAVGAGAPEVFKLRPYYNHPGFIQALADGLRAAMVDAGTEAPVLMSAHSIPVSMANRSDYEAQLRETASLVAGQAGVADRQWELVFQSRSGPPAQPWLGPDLLEAIRDLPAATESVVVAPIGFVSDHMEVVYDLDVQAAEAAAGRDLRFVRAATPGLHPAFVRMVTELVAEVEDPAGTPARSLGGRGPAPSPCLAGCCPAPSRPDTSQTVGSPPVDSAR
jgi:ferrochelatase